ncbi:hypothetical protein ACO9S2_15330 [Nitrospira sp. NS4]|uniref:hypothetical protein n=1 Tax=Nitrospira sp. NS4 TaxID=3414498 RepID=UPI003C2FDF40
MNIATMAGIAPAIGSTIEGQVLEGAHIDSILQLTTVILVIGAPSLRVVCNTHCPLLSTQSGGIFSHRSSSLAKKGAAGLLKNG